jgi:uncharacterized RDD family membrane protein YckC
VSAVPAPVPFGGLVTRAFALAIDVAIAQLTVVTGLAIAGAIASLVNELRPAWLVGLIAGVAWFLVVGGYFVVFWTVTGHTPGMRLMCVRVQGRDGEPPHVIRSMVRFVAMLLCIVPIFLGFLPVALTERRRGLHDMLAGTVVVYDDAHPAR